MKELQVLTNALDAAVKAGVFNLQDTGTILQAINIVGQKLQQLEPLQNEPQASAPSPKGSEDVLPPKKRGSKS